MNGTTGELDREQAVKPDPSKHVRYTRGMVLGVDDFTQEFAYLSGRDAWLGRDTIGYGTVSGLHVRTEPEGQTVRVVVTPGVALSPQGQMIRVCAEQCANLDDWIATHRTDVEERADRRLARPPDDAVSVYVVLCYRDCPTDPLPIPGEPCRGEDEAMEESRTADDFRLELRVEPPDQREDDALRAFVGWLAAIEVGEDGDFPSVDEFSRAIRAAADALGSPPRSPGDFMEDSPPAWLRIRASQASEYLRAAFRVWVTELRPRWRPAALGHGCGCGTPAVTAGGAAADACVLLSHLRVPLRHDAIVGTWSVPAGAHVEVHEERRPYVPHLRLVHEWALLGASGGGRLAPRGAAGLGLSGHLDFYCDPLGSDSNPGTSAAPFRHPAAAVARIPKHLRHLATVYLAPGTYNGFGIAGFTFEPLPDGTPLGIAVRGTLVTATVTSGNASGISTAAANGSNSIPTWATMSDSAQNWTTGDLKGRFLKITSGPGTGQVFPIVSNTATDISIMSTTWSPPPAPVASGYVILDQGSIINVPMQVAGSVPATGAAASSPINAGILVAANVGSSRTAHIRIEAVAINLTGLANAIGINAQAPPGITINRCSFAQDIGTCVDGVGGVLRVQQCVFRTLSASVTGIAMRGSTLGSLPSGAVMNCLFDNGYQGPAMMLVSGSSNVTVGNCESSFTTGINMYGPCWVTLSGLKFVGSGNSSQQIKARIQNQSPGGCYVHLLSDSGCDISGASRSSAVELEGPHTAIFDGNLNGSGCATALRISQGARIRLSAGSGITATSEIVMDGGAAQSIASMRAASPKLLGNGYGTIVYE